MTLVNSSQVTAGSKQDRLRHLLTGESASGSGFVKPFDVAACQGRVYVSDTVQRRVLAFDFPGRRAFQIGLKDPGSLVKPLGLNTDGQCNLYVADATQKRIMIYDRDGRYVSAIGGPDQFVRLSHVAANPEGTRVFAVDTGDVESRGHRVRIFDARSGEHLFDIGKRGSDPGQFNLPRDIELAPNGKLYVVDSGNFRVQVFSQDGIYERTFGAMGSRFGQFTRPKGIAADHDSNVYVSDAAFGNFQIFTADGRLLLFIGDRASESAPGKYQLPAGIDVDEDGRIYFVGQFFRKVDIFRPVSLPAEGGYLGTRLEKR
jgi:sugar lactone lactonase YvrE